MTKPINLNYVSPETTLVEVVLEYSACLMTSSATGTGFTFGDVNQDDTFKDTDWI